MKLIYGVVLTGVLALGLTACGKQEDSSVQDTTAKIAEQVAQTASTSEQIRADIITTQQAMADVSHLFEDQQALQQKLSNVQTKAQVDEILRQQITLIEAMQTRLNAMELNTPEVKSAVDKIKQGLNDIMKVARAFIALSETSANDLQTMQTFGQDMMNALATYMAGVDEVTKLASEHGIAINADVNHEYEHVKQELQGANETHNANEAHTHQH